MKNILTQVTLNSANRLKDRSVKLSFITDLEQTGEDFMLMDSLLNQHGVIYFKSIGDMTQEEIDSLDEVDIELEGKSKSKRLRNTLYVYWKQLGEKEEYKDFYSIKMEEFIEFVKRKLD